MRRLTRFVALLLALMLPLTAIADATPSDMTTPEATREVVQTEAPTAAPAAETPTTAPEVTEAPATEAPVTETPTTAPEVTEAPTEEPSATEDPSITETEEPTETPAAEETAEPEATEEAWDENQCDHANLNCAQAPACDDPACEHLGTDVHGMTIPLCARGRWVLDREDELERSESGNGMLRAAARPVTIDLDKGDATIYRSGNYIIKGNARTNAKLTIAGERVVVLDMRAAALDTLTVGSKCVVTVQTTAQNTIGEWKIGQESQTKFTSGGAVKIEKVTRPETDDKSKVTITGGSVDAALTEADGRTMLTLAAQGVTSVTVDGKSYAADCADDDGCFYLWLRNPGEGMTWTAAVEGTNLAVTRQTTDHGSTATEITTGQVTEITAPGVYRLSGQVDAATQVRVNASGVHLILSDVTASTADALITSEEALTLTAQGNSVVNGVLFAGSGKLTINGSGTVTVEQAIPGYGTVDAPVQLNQQKLTVDGTAATLMKTADGKLLLPELEAGRRWNITGDETTLVAVSETVNGNHYNLKDTPQVTTDAAQFTVDGAASRISGSITSAASQAEAILRNVQLTGGNVLNVAGNLTAEMTGNNELLGGDAIHLEAGASLTLKATSGRTVLEQTDLTGITLEGNVQVTPESSIPHTAIMVTDGDGNAVNGKDLTLTVNGTSYQFTTHENGMIYLWGQGEMDTTDLAATDGTHVYAAAIVGGSGKATERIDIENVTVTDVDADTIHVSFTADAGTTGIMYTVGDTAADLSDTYVPEAFYITVYGGQADIVNVKAGQTVTLRVVAAADENAPFTADTVDGFSFSEVQTIKHRGLFTVDDEEELDQEYTGKAYKNPITLPRGAKIAYQGKSLKDGMPVKVGSYTMKITIPEGNDTYLPGVYEFDFKITKIPLTIIPDPNQEKLEGEDDPEEFTFTTDGLINKDKVEGVLTREEGEEAGNYAFLLDLLSAPDYYELQLAEDAYTFTIVPIGDDITGGGGEVLHPVKQTIVRNDKREVSVEVKTQDSIIVTHSRFGQIIFSTEDNQARPFTPSLSWNKETDEVLLRLRTEAELNTDGGYVTDRSGKPVWSGRYLSMGWAGLSQMHKVGVDAISLNCHGASVVLRLEDLLSENMIAYAKEQGGTLQSSYYHVTIVPVEESDQAEEAAAVDALSPLTRGWRVSVTLTVNRVETDVTDLIPSLQVTVDMKDTKELLQSMNNYKEETFATDVALYAVEKTEDGYESSALESTFVEPFMPEELNAVDFSAIMYSRDYLVTSVTAPMLVTVSWAGKTTTK